jgi:LCP family protein required for cell wall assembly
MAWDEPHRPDIDRAHGARPDFDDLTDPRRSPTIVSGPGGRISGARHGRRGHDLGIRRLFTGVAIAVAVAVVSATSIAAYAAWDVGHGLEQRAVGVGEGSGSIDGAFNVLAVGADNAPGQSSASFGDRQATLNDSNILLHVSADHTQAVAVSFPRDLITDQPQCGNSPAVQNRSLNTAYGRGGLSCVVKTVEQVSGLKIPFAVQMSFSGVVDLSDAIGGVPVCVTSSIDDPYTGLKLSKGDHTVSGSTALAFLRDRHGVGDGSDLSRISSLQQFLSSLVRKVKSNGTLEDPTKLYRLAKVASKTVTLSTSLAKPDTMVGIARTFQGIGLNRITFVQYPGTTTDPSYPDKVVPIQATADQLMHAIATDHAFTLGADSVGRGSTSESGTSSGSSGSGSSGTDGSSASSANAGSANAGGANAGSANAGSKPSATAKPEQISGVTGQTAQQRTCAVAAAG